jgi:hypothetical protein
MTTWRRRRQRRSRCLVVAVDVIDATTWPRRRRQLPQRQWRQRQ